MSWTEALPIVLTIVALEALLSADNAMVLAVIVRPLEARQRPQAMFWGLMGALALRALAVALAVYLIRLWWVEMLGGFYLMYLTLSHFIQLRTPPQKFPEAARGPRRVRFWAVVAQLNAVNLAFSVDSILVVVAVTQSYPLILVGAFLGMALIWLAASGLVRLLDRYPALESVAYLLVGWAGLKLALEGWSGFAQGVEHHPDWAVHLSQGFFLIVTAVIFVLGLWYAVRQGRMKEEE
jgi:YkoY family integral membrane protein